jgi:septum formation protein
MIILASTSATRQSILRNAGVMFTAMSPDVDERALAGKNPDWTPTEIAYQLAAAKALDVASHHPDALVIGADQVLAMDHKIYSKPRDSTDCAATLRELRGKSHQLISSVVCASGKTIIWSKTDHADLAMRDFSDEFIDSYLSAIGDDCTTSVGGYKIEGIGIQLFESVRGDHFTILGLPLLPLLAYLRDNRAIAS